MRTIRQEIRYSSRKDVVTLCYLTDLHVGAKACNEKQLMRDVETIANDENAYWIGGGDYVEAICHIGDKRYRPSVLAKWALGHDDVMGAQAKRVREILKPIARKCLGLVRGNHEVAAETFYGRNLYWQIVQSVAEDAGVPPESLALGVNGFVDVSFRRQVANSSGDGWRMSVYCHHGFGGGRLPGGHALTLGRVLSDFHCDLALLGHRHVELALTKYITRSGGQSGKLMPRIAAFIPSYLNSWIKPSSDKQPLDSYAENFGLPPLPIGTRPVTIYPSERKFGVTIQNAPGLFHLIGKEEVNA